MALASNPPHRQLEPDALHGILADHDAWLRSDGDDGTRANLAETDLADADLSGCNLTRAILTGADLSGADLCHTLLDHAQLDRADLSGAELCNASLVGAGLTWANLSGADLTDADLSRATLSDADLTRARLVRANFTNAEMDGADLVDADIDGAVMDGADLSGARFAASDDQPDGHLDDAFDADRVYHEPELEPVSELPDADLTEPEPVQAASPKTSPQPTPTDPDRQAEAAEPAPEAPVIPGGPTDRTRKVAEAVAAHQRWLQSDGAEGRRADLSNMAPLPLTALAGADLSHATLPPGEPLRLALEHATALANRARRATILVVLACLYAVVTLLGAVAIPGAPVRLPLLGLPVGAPFVAVGIPALLLVMYLWLQGTIQRLGTVIASLPRLLPDGSAPGSGTCITSPRAGNLLWTCSRLLTQLFAWAAVPGTLALYWGAFLPHATRPGSMMLAMFIAIACGVGMFSWVRLRNRLD